MTSDAMAKAAFSHGWRLFVADAARWVVPESVAPVEHVTLRVIARMLLIHPPLRAMGWFRLGSALKAFGVRGVPHWTERRILRLYGLELPVGAAVGGGLYVAHPVGCVLVAESIGENVTVISQVTFGMRDTLRWPIVDDGVFVGAGARILGAITVGRGARVGANAVVLHDVEPGATVVGIPARTVDSGRPADAS